VSSEASRLVTNDFPTPPLPETTAMTFFTSERLLGSYLDGSVRAPQPSTPQLPQEPPQSSGAPSGAFFSSAMSPPCKKRSSPYELLQTVLFDCIENPSKCNAYFTEA
jgi:hypothetical protein